MRIALFVADVPPQPVVDEDGDYVKIFNDLIHKVDQSIQLEPFMVYDEKYPNDLSQYKAVIITGSKASAYDQDSWVVKLRSYVKEQVPAHPQVKWIGVCFGHQIFAEALGGKVEKNLKGWEVGHSTLNMLPAAQGLFGSIDKLRIMQMHKDHVTKLPDGFVNLASNRVSENQMMVKGTKMLSLQSHPEFTSSIVKKLILLRQESGLFQQGREDVAQWLRVVDDPLDGVLFAKKVVEFIKVSP